MSSPGIKSLSNVVSTADGRTVLSVEGPMRPKVPPSSNYNSEAKIYLYEIDTASGTLISRVENDYTQIPSIIFAQQEGARDSLVLSGGMAILSRYAQLYGATTPPPPYWSF